MHNVGRVVATLGCHAEVALQVGPWRIQLWWEVYNFLFLGDSYNGNSCPPGDSSVHGLQREFVYFTYMHDGIRQHNSKSRCMRREEIYPNFQLQPPLRWSGPELC